MSLLFEWLENTVRSRTAVGGSGHAIIYHDTYLSWRGLLHRVERRAREIAAMGIRALDWAAGGRHRSPRGGALHTRRRRRSQGSRTRCDPTSGYRRHPPRSFQYRARHQRPLRRSTLRLPGFRFRTTGRASQRRDPVPRRWNRRAAPGQDAHRPSHRSLRGHAARLRLARAGHQRQAAARARHEIGLLGHTPARLDSARVPQTLWRARAFLLPRLRNRSRSRRSRWNRARKCGYPPARHRNPHCEQQRRRAGGGDDWAHLGARRGRSHHVLADPARARGQDCGRARTARELAAHRRRGPLRPREAPSPQPPRGRYRQGRPQKGGAGGNRKLSGEHGAREGRASSRRIRRRRLHAHRCAHHPRRSLQNRCDARPLRQALGPPQGPPANRNRRVARYSFRANVRCSCCPSWIRTAISISRIFGRIPPPYSSAPVAPESWPWCALARAATWPPPNAPPTWRARSATSSPPSAFTPTMRARFYPSFGRFWKSWPRPRAWWGSAKPDSTISTTTRRGRFSARYSRAFSFSRRRSTSRSSVMCATPTTTPSKSCTPGPSPRLVGSFTAFRAMWSRRAAISTWASTFHFRV